MRAVLLFAVVAAASCLVAEAHFDKVHPMEKVRVENIVERVSNGGTISIDTPILNGTGSYATVSWANVGSTYPGNFDWIGVWSPKPDNWTTTTPAKYKYVIPDGNGSGATELWFVNMRDSYTVAYFTGGLTNPTLLAVSEPVEFSNYHVPMQIHLAYTDDPTQMIVQWTTQQNMFPSLQFGTSAAKLDHTVMRVNSSSYLQTDMCGAPASTKGWRAPGHLHQALLTGLTPNTQYYYTVGDESSYSKSDVLSFFSAPVQSAQTEVDFIIFGDLGQVELDGSNEASQMDGSIFTTVALQQDFEEGIVAQNRSAAVFHIGDISVSAASSRAVSFLERLRFCSLMFCFFPSQYARGYATLWEQFFYQISNISGSIPWMTCDGNHERDYPNSGSVWNGTDSGGECGVAYDHRFKMPTSSLDSTWWSLNYGPVHFTILSTEHDFSVGSAQYDWVEADLAAVDRTKTPFVVIAGHRPMYIDSTNAGPGGSDLGVAADLRTAFEPLMQKYQVDVGFWGSVDAHTWHTGHCD
jgi:hypothetical protein